MGQEISAKRYAAHPHGEAPLVPHDSKTRPSRISGDSEAPPELSMNDRQLNQQHECLPGKESCHGSRSEPEEQQSTEIAQRAERDGNQIEGHLPLQADQAGLIEQDRPLQTGQQTKQLGG